MKPMHRTQIYLDSDLNAALDRLARKRKTSKANLIRMAAGRFVEEEQAGEDDAILGIIGLGNAGSGQVSVDHDRVLGDHVLRKRLS